MNVDVALIKLSSITITHIVIIHIYKEPIDVVKALHFVVSIFPFIMCTRTSNAYLYIGFHLSSFVFGFVFPPSRSYSVYAYGLCVCVCLYMSLRLFYWTFSYCQNCTNLYAACLPCSILNNNSFSFFVVVSLLLPTFTHLYKKKHFFSTIIHPIPFCVRQLKRETKKKIKRNHGNGTKQMERHRAFWI